MIVQRVMRHYFEVLARLPLPLPRLTPAPAPAPAPEKSPENTSFIRVNPIEIGQRRMNRMEGGFLKNAIASFTEKFQKEKDEIEKKCEISLKLDENQLPDHLNDIENRIETLQKYLTDSVNFLRPYDVRIGQETLKSLRDLLDNQRDTMIPKKKFTFKSRKRETDTKRTISTTDCVDGPISDLFSHDKVNCGFDNLSGQRLIKREEEIADNEVDVRRLRECQVFLIGCPSTVRFNRLRRCQVYCGPVKTSVFIDNCNECVFMLACQQLRLHSSVDSDFYLHVTSGPIIEDSTRIRVAPYNFTYPGIDVHFVASGLTKANNNWNLVNDFNWLAADMNSPNWQIIPDQERKDARSIDAN
uniref:C-CAP/cofactor C-like domain-containing protein n=1 Tax=Strigamia maritima TaxID=126957 RepID=T1JGM5_STRMM